LRAQAEIYGAIALVMLLTLGAGLYVSQLNEAMAFRSELSSLITWDSMRRAEKIYARLENGVLLVEGSVSSAIASLVVFDSSGVLYENTTRIHLNPGETIEYTIPSNTYLALLSGEAVLGVFTEHGNFITLKPEVPETAGSTALYGNVEVHVLNPPQSVTGDILFFNYTGKGVLSSISLVTFNAAVSVTRIVIDGRDLLSNNITVGGVIYGNSGTASSTPASLTLQLNIYFNTSLQVYGRVLLGSNPYRAVIVVIVPGR